jgi:hypothetical protein
MIDSRMEIIRILGYAKNKGNKTKNIRKIINGKIFLISSRGTVPL